jgi:hypothetical protein
MCAKNTEREREHREIDEENPNRKTHETHREIDLRDT